MSIEPGLFAETKLIVTDEDTAARFKGGRFAPVLSTPKLVGYIEGTGHDAIKSCLGEGQTSVGISINIRHIAATPVGMEVHIRADLIEVDKRKLKFKVEAWDEVEKIADGEHERFIIDWDRFMEKVDQKRQVK